ncbi:MAG: pyridoxal-phosphate dependent enzyme [Patescibacteria group bacterium]|nr:pyridoxal-phosphate dependent enzyme [Patescibacteria group bacterium]
MSIFQNKIQRNEKGVWRYAEFYDELIKPENRLKLNNEGTRELEIEDENKSLKNINHLYFKREDENKTGSLKDRSLAYQVSLAKQNNKKDLVISTSGNAGISAAAYCRKAKIKLYIFISPETEKAKIAEMQKYQPIIIKSKRAIRLANYLSAKYKIENLRPSANDSSLEGFKAIAFEIFENLGEVNAIFTFVTSGSSFVGIGRAYQYLLENKEIEKMPRLYAVRGEEEFSVAGKLGIKNTRRRKEILEIIKLSGGKETYINNDEIQKAKNILEKNKIHTSFEGCASFAGVVKVNEKNKFNKTVCILSGRLRDEVSKINESGIYKAETFGEVERVVGSGNHLIF